MAGVKSGGNAKPDGAGRRREGGKKKLARPMDARRLGGRRKDGLEESRLETSAGRGGDGSLAAESRNAGARRRDLPDTVTERSGRPPSPRGRLNPGTRAVAAERSGGGDRSKTGRSDRGRGEPRDAGSPRAVRGGARISRLSPRAVILALLLLMFVGFALGPTLRNLEANSRLKGKEAELRKQRSYTESLEKEVKEAGSMRYIEEEARKQRMVAPGEVLYLVTSDDGGPRIEYRVKSLQSMEEAWERVRRVLNCGYVVKVKESG